MTRKRQDWQWSLGLSRTSGLRPLPWHFVCSDSVYRPTKPCEKLMARSHFTDEVTEAQRGKVTCLRSHSMCVGIYVPHF